MKTSSTDSSTLSTRKSATVLGFIVAVLMVCGLTLGSVFSAYAVGGAQRGSEPTTTVVSETTALDSVLETVSEDVVTTVESDSPNSDQEIFGKCGAWSTGHYNKTNLLGHTVDKEQLNYSSGENVTYTVTPQDVEQGYFEEEIELYFNVPQLGDPGWPEQPGISLTSFTGGWNGDIGHYYGVYKFQFHIPLKAEASGTTPTITNVFHSTVNLPHAGAEGTVGLAMLGIGVTAAAVISKTMRRRKLAQK